MNEDGFSQIRQGPAERLSSPFGTGIDLATYFLRDTPLCAEVVFKAKPSPAAVMSPSPEGTVGEEIAPPIYTDVNHGTWSKMLAKQSGLVASRACPEYLEGKRLLEFPAEHVPHLADLSRRLKAISGWQIVRVSGFVLQDIFFEMLANRLFPCTDFVRHPDEIEYTPAPDMFHDLLGHLPMITNARYATFFQAFGLAGTRATKKEDLDALARIYWFTVEFGMKNRSARAGRGRSPEAMQAYGAGLCSSTQEIVHAFSEDARILRYDVDAIAAKPYDIHHVQEEYFEVASFEELEVTFTSWARKRSLL